MKPAFLLLFCWLLLGCVAPGSRSSDSRDYAITTCEATPQRIELVQKRARNYLSRHPDSAAEVRFLAVTADSVFPSEVQDLWIKLGRSQTSSSAYLQRRGQSFKLWCVSCRSINPASPDKAGICAGKHPGTRGGRSNRRPPRALCWNRGLGNLLTSIVNEASFLNPQMTQIDADGKRDSLTDLVVEALVPRACG